MKASQKPKSRKELYKAQYEASKRGGEPFAPDVIWRDALIALIVVAAVFILAATQPALSESPADPTSTTYNPRPEWYFFFFFEFLKFFPGYLEPLSAVIIPAVAVIIVFLVPFFDRGLARDWSHRKKVVTIGGLLVAVFFTLEIAGAISAPPRPGASENPDVIAGQRTYRERNCAYCHSINGVGGAVGTELSRIGASMNRDTLTAYLSNPSSMIPHTLHPKLVFTTEDLNNLVTYLLTLGAPVYYSPEAPGLTEKNCLSCHRINGNGGTVGPDLSNEGNFRTMAFLESFIADPRSQVASATMPAFKDVLSPAQIHDIAAYLYSLKKPAPAAPPLTPTATPAPTPTVTPPPSPSPTPSPATFGQMAIVGQTAYSGSCAACHGSQGQGGSAQALIGSRARLAKYGNAQALLNYISRTMPPGTTLPHQEYLNILSYLLMQNNDVSGGTPFDESQLSGIVLK
ncbi:MAG: c-type cytochrome [Dehalococcoidales bacterium]|nr:c-type cytochrome [Dehalococcoidales bacterium]